MHRLPHLHQTSRGNYACSKLCHNLAPSYPPQAFPSCCELRRTASSMPSQSENTFVTARARIGGSEAMSALTDLKIVAVASSQTARRTHGTSGIHDLRDISLAWRFVSILIGHITTIRIQWTVSLSLQITRVPKWSWHPRWPHQWKMKLLRSSFQWDIPLMRISLSWLSWNRRKI